MSNLCNMEYEYKKFFFKDNSIINEKKECTIRI